MGDQTAIEWTDKTWNPWQGCTKVSPGCENCYMFREKKHYGQDPDRVVRSKPPTFDKPLKWQREAEAIDARWLVFTCSWSDWFHVDADPWRKEAWDIVKHTPRLTYQILTKRSGRIARHLPDDWGNGYPNVWLGVSVETQNEAYRIRHLADVPAAVHFVSAEPLLGPLNLGLAPGSAELEWVIAGGESGPDARPCWLNWLRDLRRQCALAGIPFFLKQLGGYPDAMAHERAVLDGQRYTAFPRDPTGASPPSVAPSS